MNTSKEAHIFTKPFMEVAMAPVVVFLLANVLFLPLLVALDISRGGFLADLVSSSRNPFIQDFILIIAGYCCLPVSAIAVLVGPPLTSFIANRKHPTFTDKSKATLGGGVFLAFYAFFLVIVLVLRFIGNFQSMYATYIALTSMKPSFFIPYLALRFLDPLPCILTLGGIVLSYSVAIAGRFGAKRGSLKHREN